MSKSALYIPGLPGSHLDDQSTGKRLFLNIPALLSPTLKKEILRRLRGPEDLMAGDNVVSGPPIRRSARLIIFDLAKQAESLYDILKNVGVDPVKFGWDWRRPVYDGPMLAKLKKEIEKLNNTTGRRVVVIVHSTGGLVLRRLLEKNSQNKHFLNRIERVIAFGVPWAGTLKSLQFLTGKKSFGLGLISRKEAQELLCHSWAAFDLLPPDPEKTDLSDTSGRLLNLVIDGNGKQVTPLKKRDWFHPDLRPSMNRRADGADREFGRRSSSFDLPARNVPLTNVVGWGWETSVQAKILGSGSQQQVRIFSNKGDTTLDGGDGTVPRISAAWIRGSKVNTYHVPVGFIPGSGMSPHSVLWRNPGGVNLLRHLLGGKPLKSFIYGAVDAQDYTGGDRVRVRLVALDGEGRPLTNATVRVTDLVGGKILQNFKPLYQGRHILKVPRARIRIESNTLRRFTIEIRGTEGSQLRKKRLSFFVSR